MKTLLLTGGCGTGKTWVMLELVKQLNLSKHEYAGLYTWIGNEQYAILGKYDGSVFQGGDRLSMAIMQDNDKAAAALSNKIVIAEGDRFTNNTFIDRFNPFIIRIENDGTKGRKSRGTSQTERHIKSIQSRVNNLECHLKVKDSTEALDVINEYIATSFPEAPAKKQQGTLLDFLNHKTS